MLLSFCLYQPMSGASTVPSRPPAATNRPYFPPLPTTISHGNSHAAVASPSARSVNTSSSPALSSAALSSPLASQFLQKQAALLSKKQQKIQQWNSNTASSAAP